MSQINPFTGSILQAPQVQRQQSTEKDRRLRRAADTAKDSALAEDRLEHQVESSDVVSPAHPDDQHHDEQKRKSKKKAPSLPPRSDADDESKLRVDLTA